MAGAPARLLAGTAALALAWGELESWRSSRRCVAPASGTTEVVVVLGCRNAGRRANALNRWRVRAGIRSCDPRASRCRLVFCGGAVAGTASEAALMARYATGARGYRGEVVLEERSRSTWENVRYALPLVEGFDRIKIVSDPLHAEKARRYLAYQRPDLAARLVRGAEYRFGEWLPLKVVFAAYGRLRLRSAGRRPAGRREVRSEGLEPPTF